MPPQIDLFSQCCFNLMHFFSYAIISSEVKENWQYTKLAMSITYQARLHLIFCLVFLFSIYVIWFYFFFIPNKKGKIKKLERNCLLVLLSNIPFSNGRSLFVNSPNRYVHFQCVNNTTNINDPFLPGRYFAMWYHIVPHDMMTKEEEDEDYCNKDSKDDHS